MTNHALVLVGPITARCASPEASQSPHWLPVIQANGPIATTIGVLIALYIAAIRDPREASEERKHHLAQMDALYRVKRERVGAQARKLVPSSARTPMFGDSWWMVRIDNTSNAAATILAVDVTGLDTNGIEIRGGCRQANNMMPVDQVIDRPKRAALSCHLNNQLQPAVRHALRDAAATHFVTGWPQTRPPREHAVMAYTTTYPITSCASRTHQIRLRRATRDRTGTKP